MAIQNCLLWRHRPNTLDTVVGEQIKSNRQTDCIAVIAEYKIQIIPLNGAAI
jgi:hypothetical protein